MKSIFSDKYEVPNEEMLKKALGPTFESWQILHEKVKLFCPDSTEEWKFSGEKFGWSFRVSDRKRVLVYLLPRDQFFKVAFVFGQTAFERVLSSTVADVIKKELVAAKPYAEGRGIRIEVRDASILNDILVLLTLKVSS